MTQDFARALAGALLLLPLGTLLAKPSPSGCQIRAQDPRGPRQDALGVLLESTKNCPKDVFELQALFRGRGVRTDTALVANRGTHNPKLGSFSLFECAKGPVLGADRILGPGDLFWGHFTTRDDAGRLTPDQTPRRGALMIEAISWDPTDEVYRFYELIGDGERGLWFERGSSLDILADTQNVHLPRAKEQEIFGDRLRCSGCHLLGGPILKEMAPPHEAWWTSKRKLPFGEGGPDPRLGRMLESLVDAEELAENVRTGMRRLLRGKAYRSWREGADLRQLLRPLLAPMELQLDSSPRPLERMDPRIPLPPSQWLDPRLGSPARDVTREDYLLALRSTKSRFPETDRSDTDHPWLGPGKSWSDREWAEVLIEEGYLSREFLLELLALDSSRPVFSEARLSLLRQVPKRLPYPGWQEDLRRALEKAKLELDSPGSTPIPGEDSVESLLRWQQARRAEISKSEISKNPRGQILEPGFRVIFPIPLAK